MEWFKQTNTQEVAVAFIMGMILQTLLPVIGGFICWFI